MADKKGKRHHSREVYKARNTRVKNKTRKMVRSNMLTKTVAHRTAETKSPTPKRDLKAVPRDPKNQVKLAKRRKERKVDQLKRRAVRRHEAKLRAAERACLRRQMEANGATPEMIVDAIKAAGLL